MRASCVMAKTVDQLYLMIAIFLGINATDFPKPDMFAQSLREQNLRKEIQMREL